MRIISGKNKGRLIIAPTSLPSRPTTDFAKQGLFNILANRVNFEDIKFLDLFAGTGNISYEMASRGCGHITAVDSDAGCYRFIQQTAEKMKFNGFRVYKADALKYIETCGEKFDVIFADPPFSFSDTALLPNKILNANVLNENGVLIVEHPSQVKFDDHPALQEQRRYGIIHFSFFTE